MTWQKLNQEMKELPKFLPLNGFNNCYLCSFWKWHYATDVEMAKLYLDVAEVH
jgi:hypothetical protein